MLIDETFKQFALDDSEDDLEDDSNEASSISVSPDFTVPKRVPSLRGGVGGTLSSVHSIV